MRDAEILRLRAFPMEMRIQLAQEIRYFHNFYDSNIAQARFVFIFFAYVLLE